MKTKDKIVMTSIELFNRSGVVAVTTNHIAKELDISPGNLYFHFRNKEEIIRQIFRLMAKETYQLGRTKKGAEPTHPLDFIGKHFEIFWKYRFLHREMYYLRRKDSALAKLWKAHMVKMRKMLILVYKRWIKLGWMQPIQSAQDTEFMSTILLATASNFLQFFESAEHIPQRTHLETGKQYVAWLLVLHTQGKMREDFQAFIRQNRE